MKDTIVVYGAEEWVSFIWKVPVKDGMTGLHIRMF